MSTFVQISQAAGVPVSITQQTTTEVANTPELITTPGAGSWTKPAGVTKVLVECWGGGGAGGGVSLTNSFGGGGAGGQYARKLITYSSTQQSIPYSLAALVAGTAGAGATGNDTTWDTNVVVAKGGAGGTSDNTSTVFAGGVSGSAVGGIGDVVYAGGNGAGGFWDSATPTLQSGAGGGGAGSTGKGSDATFYNNSDTTPDYGGEGGDGVIISSAKQAGSSPLQTFTPSGGLSGGGGGAGKTSGGGAAGTAVGGDGAQGLIRITTYSTITVGTGRQVTGT